MRASSPARAMTAQQLLHCWVARPHTVLDRENLLLPPHTTAAERPTPTRPPTVLRMLVKSILGRWSSFLMSSSLKFSALAVCSARSTLATAATCSRALLLPRLAAAMRAAAAPRLLLPAPPRTRRCCDEKTPRPQLQRVLVEGRSDRIAHCARPSRREVGRVSAQQASEGVCWGGTGTWVLSRVVVGIVAACGVC